MAWLKSLGCGCDECGEDACEDPAPIVLSETLGADVGVYWEHYVYLWDRDMDLYRPGFQFGSHTFEVTGLPADLDYNPATGLIAGTPTEDWSGTITICATDDCGTTCGTITLTIGSGSMCAFFLGSNWDIPGGSDAYDVTGQFTVGNYVRIFGNPDVGVTGFRVSGTIGSASFDSGTLSFPTVYDHTVFVPAGATSIDFDVEVAGFFGANVTVEFECLGP